MALFRGPPSQVWPLPWSVIPSNSTRFCKACLQYCRHYSAAPKQIVPSLPVCRVLEQAPEDSQSCALPSAPSSRWFFVRVKASTTTGSSKGSGAGGSGAGGSSNGGDAGQHPGRRQYQPRRLDFQLDLRQDFQAAALEDLLAMGPEELQVIYRGAKQGALWGGVWKKGKSHGA